MLQFWTINVINATVFVSRRWPVTRPRRPLTDLGYAMLILLDRGPLTGYEINKRFASSIVFFWHARPSQIYAELRRLEQLELVRQIDEPGADRRRRNVFAITPAGRTALLEWLATPTPMQRTKDEMQLKAFAFEQVDPSDAVMLFDQHRRLHEERLATYQRDRERLVRRYGDPADTVDPAALFRFLSIDYGIAYESTYVRWCGEAARLVRCRLLAGQPRDGTATPAGPDGARPDR